MDTRDRILDAAAHVMRTRGFARTTTKQIARAAGYSEATLYKHFTDKSDLFLAVLHERLPGSASFPALLDEHGDGSLRDRLAAAAAGAITFYQASFPVSASIFSEPDLLAAHRAAVTRRGLGPQRPVEMLAGFLRDEQRRGAVRDGADCDAAAALLLGACFQYAFLRAFAQRPADPEAAGEFAQSVTDTLLGGLVPAAR